MGNGSLMAHFGFCKIFRSLKHADFQVDLSLENSRHGPTVCSACYNRITMLHFIKLRS